MNHKSVNLFLVAVFSVASRAIATSEVLYGTGDNLGSSWRSDGNVGYRDTEDNLGSGWRSDGNGELRGTGDNLGRGYRVRWKRWVERYRRQSWGLMEAVVT